MYSAIFRGLLFASAISVSCSILHASSHRHESLVKFNPGALTFSGLLADTLCGGLVTGFFNLTDLLASRISTRQRDTPPPLSLPLPLLPTSKWKSYGILTVVIYRGLRIEPINRLGSRQSYFTKGVQVSELIDSKKKEREREKQRRERKKGKRARTGGSVLRARCSSRSNVARILTAVE